MNSGASTLGFVGAVCSFVLASTAESSEFMVALRGAETELALVDSERPWHTPLRKTLALPAGFELADPGSTPSDVSGEIILFPLHEKPEIVRRAS